MENKITLKELQERQKWSLEQKIDHSLGTIDQFLSRTNGQAYVSFSGGKDSTVLLHLCRILKPDIKGVFCNTGVEFPDIVKFVRQQDNIEIIRPEKTIKQIIKEFGFPLISKEISQKIWYVRNRPNSVRAKEALGLQGKMKGIFEIPFRWKCFINKDYDICDKCCDYLKKKPFHNFKKANKLYPIIGTMTDESFARQTGYIKRGGCNSFDDKKKSSHPLSIWTEKDIWEYITKQNLSIAEIYYKGAHRTGCVGCGYGAYHKDDDRFDMLFRLYPKFYNMFMSYENNGVTYREALRDMLTVTGKYLPDEQPIEKNRQLELF